MAAAFDFLAPSTWWSALSGFFDRKDPLVATRQQMLAAEAFVDPSRLFAGGRVSLPYNPSVLATRKGLNVFDQMKRDEQVKAALTFKKLAVLASGWEVVSPADQDSDWEVTEFVREALRALPGGVPAALTKVLLGIDYGYSVTEKIYEERAEGALRGKLVIARLSSAKPHYFDFQQASDGRLLAVIQRWVPGSPVQEFPPDKFILFAHQQEFENPYGRSDLEEAYRSWWVKDNAYKWFAIYLERYGMAPLFALYNPSSYQGGDLTELKKVVRNIQSATMGLIPRGAKDDLELWSMALSQGSRGVFLAALARFDADIGKALLQPSLTGFSGEGAQGEARGSLARSNVHWRAFLNVVGALQTQLAAVVNEQLVRQLCDLNYASLGSYPEFRFGRLNDELELDLFKVWDALVQGRVVGRIKDDEGHIRKALGFPENDAPTLEELPSGKAAGGGADGIPGIETGQKKQFALDDVQFERLLDELVRS